MKAMVLKCSGEHLELEEVPVPSPGPGQVLVKVEDCGVCRTDLHVIDGELHFLKLPLIPGHEIVGEVAALGMGVEGVRLHDRVGIPWLGWTCGGCEYCLTGRENLCDAAKFTGYTLDGGYAEYAIADARYCFPLSKNMPSVAVAPLLCAGLIGYRSLLKTGDGQRLGLYGFGAAAHILIQVARHQGREVYAFTRKDNDTAQEFARSLGAVWAGASEDKPPCLLDAAIIFAPVGELVPLALRSLRKGGVVVCGGIHMSDIPAFPYAYLWEERSIVSVANLTRRDGVEFLSLAPSIPVTTETHAFPLEAANEALTRLREGRISGAAVLVPSLAYPLSPAS
ncbi:zinc-binding alcohol dehydrogenase family protein [Roseimicrobium gellanilyticum]